MSESDRGSARPAAASGRPGVRVIELHVLGLQVQLLSINIGRRWPRLGSWWSPATGEHRPVDRTITVGWRDGFIDRCGLGNPIDQYQFLPLLSAVLDRLRRSM